MKRYNFYLKGELIYSDTEEDIKTKLRPDWRDAVLELSIGDREVFLTETGGEWEIERVV